MGGPWRMTNRERYLATWQRWREGGYIPFCDHHVPPDVPLAHFRHCLAALRAI